ncbi:cell wall hydrolase [Metabacillus litoralis]|uniref:cell wall hydrolase n=1 Tax=Metabacillus litoralis TaxID=152268 RepID=UPI001CFC79E2|nr:cell wall hydrolase [Metabacillus litoralis]
MKKLIFLLTFLTTLFMAVPSFAYTVQKGDTMSEIAKQNGLSLTELAKANPQVKNLDLIYIGQEIHINKSNTPPQKPSRGKRNEHKISGISQSDFDLLARIVRAEAQSEPFEGKVAVASVVLNRVESPKFPNTIKEVIYQRGQFQPVANGQVNKPADQESIKAAQAALSDMRHIAKGSLFFYNPDIATSRWLDSRETTVVIGQHVFKN